MNALHKTPTGTEKGTSSVPTRDQINVADTWDLTALFPTEEAYTEAFKNLQNTYSEITELKGKIGESARSLRDCLEMDRELDLKIERLGHYAGLKGSEDSADAANLARESQFSNLMTQIGEAVSFILPEIQAIEDDTFATYLKDPLLKKWVIPLTKLRRMKPHTLSTAEERLLALGHTALAGHEDTFSQLTNVDMKFGVLVDENGHEQALSQSSFSSFLVKRDPELRKKAFHQFYEEISDHQYTLAASLSSSVRADVFHGRARNYPNARKAALFRDDVPESVYDRLISSVRANLKPLFRYYELRRKLLNLDEVHHYDTYVPIVPDIETDVSFDEAVDTVITALAPLGGEYTDVLGRGLRNERWCDRYENKGKRSGAFSSSSYGNPPYLLMNYKADVYSDIYTLAHEAGHSMHSWYSQRNQPYQTYNYPIFLAEVASTFNEELLTHHLLETTDDPKMRAYLINRQIDDIRGTVYRQTMFAEFEKIIHEMEEAGEALTLDTLRKAYRGLLDAYFGENFTIDSELELECLRIPHFYSAFYVYKYATGISAAVTLSQDVLKTGEVGRYHDFLCSGSSQFPIPTLKDAGVDMSSPEPVDKTLSLFARRVEELEGLLG
ncbi:MAG: oligoendopeptidase F [Verrucomicrobia bacterium]|nr:MAG: oligoendopeptidase F [Verrucomicrobiota bacterium]